MKASGPSGSINDLAQSLVLKTLVCSTNEDAWKWSNLKRKTDNDGALKLTRMFALLPFLKTALHRAPSEF